MEKTSQAETIDQLKNLIKELQNKEKEYLIKSNVAHSMRAKIIRQLPQNVLGRNIYVFFNGRRYPFIASFVTYFIMGLLMHWYLAKQFYREKLTFRKHELNLLFLFLFLGVHRMAKIYI